jgi:hypothetical protein
VNDVAHGYEARRDEPDPNQPPDANGNPYGTYYLCRFDFVYQPAVRFCCFFFFRKQRDSFSSQFDTFIAFFFCLFTSSMRDVKCAKRRIGS